VTLPNSWVMSVEAGMEGGSDDVEGYDIITSMGGGVVCSDSVIYSFPLPTTYYLPG
jgi:hypothetical protein